MKAKGFTIVEILMSVLLVSIGMFALAGMQVSAIKGNVLGGDISVAANLMNARLMELKSYPYFFSMSTGAKTIDPRLEVASTSIVVNAMADTDADLTAIGGYDGTENVKYTVRTILTSPPGVDANQPGAYRIAIVQVTWDDTSDPNSDKPLLSSGPVPILMQIRP